MKNRSVFALICAATAGAAVTLLAPAARAQADARFAMNEPPAVETFGIPGLPAQERAVVIPLSKQLGAAPMAVPLASLPAIDHASLIAEDFAPRKLGEGTKPLRVGIARPFKLEANAGTWTPRADGGWLWSLDVRAEAAHGVRVHFVDLALPAGSQLVAFDPQNPGDIGGPYEGRGDFDSAEQYTPVIWSDTVRIELSLPIGSPMRLPFDIDLLQHIYRDPHNPHAPNNPQAAMPAAQPGQPGEGAAKSSARANPDTNPDVEPPTIDPNATPRVGTCHNDVTCSTAWANQAKAVAIYYISDGAGTGQCTGQLVTSTNNDLTPYFLTASHCVATATVANTTDAYWLYQTTTCNAPATVPALGSLSRTTGAVLVGTRGTSDGTLLRLTGSLPGGLFYMGWTSTTPANGTAIAGIHHPDGSWKRISFGNVSQTSTCGAVAAQISSESLRVDWTSGVTEGGSSGSGIMRIDTQQLVGTLSCGSSACPFTVGGENDTYGRFSSFFNTIGTSLNGFPDDAREPNDSCAAANFVDLTTAQNLTNLVVKAVSQDWYRFTLPAGSQLSVTLTFTATTGNIDMRLYNACAGTQLASSTGTTGTETLTYTNSGGTSTDVYLNVFLTGTSPLNTYTMAATRGAVTLTNDRCANAYTLVPGTTGLGATITDSTAAATFTSSEVPASSCVASVTSWQTPDVWYTYTAPSNGTLALDTCGSPTDTILIVYSGCGGTQLSCSDDATANGPCAATNTRVSATSTALTAGQTVKIRISIYGRTGAYNLRTLFPPSAPAPANDNCSGAAQISTGTTNFDTTSATSAGPSETLCNFVSNPNIYKDIWYAYTAPAAGTLLASTCGTTFDTKLAAYSACPGSTVNTAIACDDDAVPTCTTGSTLGSALTLNLTPNQIVLLRVGSYSSATTGNVFGPGMITLTFTAAGPTPCTPSDVAGSNQSIGPDGALSADDIIVFLGWFFASDARADVAGPNQSPTPDTEFTADDIIVFLARYFQGC